MRFLNCALVIAIGIVCCGNEGSSQGLIDTIFVNYTEQCVKTGNNFGGFLPPEAAWFININCKNYLGSVGCKYEKPEDPAGTCQCNLDDDAYFDVPLQVCLGKVGAYCTAEKTDLIPPKLCTPNADCVSIQSEGHTVGKCQCVYGFKNENGLCVPDDDIPDGERSTPRTTTTTEAPDRGNVKLPLDLLLGATIVGYEGECQGQTLFPLLNRTYCDTHGLTVACSANKKCECNMGGDDSILDETLNMCVGRAGSYCLTRGYLLGYKGCVDGADCFLEEGESEDHSFGVCKCLWGYDENPDDGTCVRNPDIPNPSTKGTGGPTPSTPPTTPASTTTTEGAGQISAAFFSIFALLGLLHFLN